MPLIQVLAQQGILDKTAQDALMSRISNAVLKAEQASIDSSGAQSLVWAYYTEYAPENIYVGGENLDKAPLRIAITTPQGALNPSTRKQLISEIGALVDEYVGTYENRLNHWAMLTEIDDGSWGGAGQVFQLSDIQKAMDIVPTTV